MYLSCEVKFSSYYKHSFTYSGKLPDGREVSMSVSGDVYRFEVVADELYTVLDLYNKAEYTFFEVRDTETQEWIEVDLEACVANKDLANSSN